MGNTSSSSGRHHDDTVDHGYLVPQGVYTGPRDWNQAVVSQLICQRRLAPFYRPLEDYEESWDDERILAARKQPASDSGEPDSRTYVEVSTSAASTHSSQKSGKRPSPIVPAICTECFVQIKRIEPTVTHVVSEPAACPYCVQDNFGIVYTPPPWRAGMGADPNHQTSPLDSPKGSQQFIGDGLTPAAPAHKRRQKSYSADAPEVVTIDQVRPDWEAKLAAVRAAVARRANRRIIMRQVGDRLIPVGVTSGRVHALNPEEAGNIILEGGVGGDNGSGSRRSRRNRQQPASFEQLVSLGLGGQQYMGLAGQDIEELMVMEAMRLSLLEHEEQQRKEKEAEEKKKREEAKGGNMPSSEGESSNAASVPGPSTVEAQLSSAPEASAAEAPGPSSLSVISISPSSSPNTRSSSSSHRHKSNPPTLNSVANPPAFSTLSAALSTASTASAVLHSSQRSLPAVEKSGAATSSTSDPATALPNAIVCSPDGASAIAETGEPRSSGGEPSTLSPSPPNDNASTASKPIPVRMDSAASSEAGPVSYDNLPSSPSSLADSYLAYEPLLSRGADDVSSGPSDDQQHSPPLSHADSVPLKFTSASERELLASSVSEHSP
ncbi:hypothetical protein FISHEDRAFT_71360 [Fistulina hepatica ATCC 64428]|nr:hypothetical protein FISHEDRAFT_71360 [Fistulina hepatica ATCC 64428]